MRAPGLRIERLSAASFIICTSLEIAKCAYAAVTERSAASTVSDQNSVLGPGNLFVINRKRLHELDRVDPLLVADAPGHETSGP